MKREHDLKTWPAPFAAIWDGEKHHEVRSDDRGFAVGDTLILHEWDPSPSMLGLVSPRGYTGRILKTKVTYISQGGTWGLPPNLCVMSIVEFMRQEQP